MCPGARLSAARPPEQVICCAGDQPPPDAARRRCGRLPEPRAVSARPGRASPMSPCFSMWLGFAWYRGLALGGWCGSAGADAAALSALLAAVPLLARAAAGRHAGLRAGGDGLRGHRTDNAGRAHATPSPGGPVFPESIRAGVPCMTAAEPFESFPPGPWAPRRAHESVDPARSSRSPTAPASCRWPALPSPESFPVEAMRAARERVLRDTPREALQYAASEGFAPPARVGRGASGRAGHGGRRRSGADHHRLAAGLDPVAKVLVDAGAPVAVETPTYLGRCRPSRRWSRSSPASPAMPTGHARGGGGAHA